VGGVPARPEGAFDCGKPQVWSPEVTTVRTGCRYAVDVHDLKAALCVQSALQKLDIGCRFEPQAVCSDELPGQVAEEFNKLYDDPETGGIICFGSWIANPMTIPLVRKIFETPPHEGKPRNERSNMPYLLTWPDTVVVHKMTFSPRAKPSRPIRSA